MFKNITSKNYAFISLVLSVIAGVIYNSWPLGYWLDRSTFKYGLASDLEKVHHPYYWLFITLDCMTGLIILIMAYINHNKLGKVLHKKRLNYVNLGLVIFAVFTIIAALLPSECSITPILRCRSIAGNGLGIDALTSTIAALGLFVSLVAVRYLSLHHNLKPWIHNLTQTIFVLWIISGLSFIYIAFTSISTHLIQQILLILSGAIIILVGINIYKIVISNEPI